MEPRCPQRTRRTGRAAARRRCSPSCDPSRAPGAATKTLFRVVEVVRGPDGRLSRAAGIWSSDRATCAALGARWRRRCRAGRHCRRRRRGDQTLPVVGPGAIGWNEWRAAVPPVQAGSPPAAAVPPAVMPPAAVGPPAGDRRPRPPRRAGRPIRCSTASRGTGRALAGSGAGGDEGADGRSGRRADGAEPAPMDIGDLADTAAAARTSSPTRRSPARAPSSCPDGFTRRCRASPPACGSGRCATR